MFVDVMMLTRDFSNMVDLFESQYTPIMTPNQSEMLTHFKIKHSIVETPKDGMCFYHALSIENPSSIKKKVINSYTREELDMINTLHGSNLEKKALYEQWADHIELTAYTRLYKVTIIIVDDVHKTITIHGNGSNVHVIQLKNTHYSRIECNSNQIMKLLNGRFCISKDYKSRKCIIM